MPSYEEYMKNKRKKKQGNTQNQNTGKNISYGEWVKSKEKQTTVDTPAVDLPTNPSANSPTNTSGLIPDGMKEDFNKLVGVFDPLIDALNSDGARQAIDIMYRAWQYDIKKEKQKGALAELSSNQKGSFLELPSYFEDGFDLSDIPKIPGTILDTGVDVLENLGTGVVELPEKIIDAAATGTVALGDYLGDKLPNIDLPINEILGEDGLAAIQKYTGVDMSDVNSIRDLNDALISMGENFVAKDLYNGQEFVDKINVYEHLTGKDVDDGSILGEKSDALVQSIGQNLATRGLSELLGIPWQAIVATSAFGSQAEKALNEGADIREATNSATISAMAEVAFEMLGGYTFGDGKKTLMDMVTEPVLKRISNTFAKKVVQWGVDVGSEGFEELLTEFVTKIGEKSYRDESFKEILFSEEALNDYVDSFLGGMLMGTVMNGGNRDTLTDSEQKVVDEKINDIIKEKESNGEKVSASEKAKIRKQVMNNLEKGYISTDDIEKIFGGDTYKEYQALVESEKALQDEIDELGKKTNPEGGTIAEQNQFAEDQKRYAELKQQLEDIKKNSKRNELKDRLSNEVFELVKDTKLRESYNEKTRRSQTYQADLSQYSEKERAIVQKAIDSGILNNTNRTHEFVDLVAKISADKGIDFDFANNQRLTETGFVLEGKQVNAVISDGKVTLNIDSHKMLESVVGHEVTHAFEGTEMYDALADSVIEYAKAKGEYDTRLKAISKLYEGVYKGDDIDAKINQELVADLVGDYLFTDTDFINTLCTEQPKLFKKIFDEIKYLCKIATGSEEASKLEKVKKDFEKVWRESKNVKVDGDTRYSLSDENIDKNQNFVYNTKRGERYAKTDDFRDLQAESRRMPEEDVQGYHRGNRTLDESLRGRISGVLKRQVGAVCGGIGNGNGLLTLYAPNGNQFNIYEGVDGSLFHDCFEISRKYLLNGELVDLHTIKTTEDGIGYDDCYNYLTEDGLSGFSITPDGDLISVFNASDKKGFLQSIKNIVKTKAKTLDCYASPHQNLMGMYKKIFGFKTASVMDYNMKYDHDDIAENHEEPKVAFMVNTDADVEVKSFTKDEYNEAAAYRNSFITQATEKSVASFVFDASKYPAYDNEGRELSTEQKSYFRDSKVVDDNVNLKVVYHGTRNANFTVFKRNINYFTDSKEMADSYSPNGDTFEGYLNIENPYEIDAMGEKWSRIPIDENTKSLIEEYGGSVFKENGKWRTTPADIASVIDEAVDNGDMDYDGIIIRNIDDTGSYYKGAEKHVATDYIVFSSNQFKNVNNTNPTDDPDINYSLSEEDNLPTKTHNGTYGDDIRLDDMFPTKAEMQHTVEDAPVRGDIAPVTEDIGMSEDDERAYFESLTDADAPPEFDAPIYDMGDTSRINDITLKGIGQRLRETLSLNAKETKAIQEVVQRYSTTGLPDKVKIFDEIKKKFGEKEWKNRIDEVAEAKRTIRGFKINVSDTIKGDIPDYKDWRKKHQSKLNFSKDGLAVDDIYDSMSYAYPDLFPADIINPTDQLLRMAEVMDEDIYRRGSQEVDSDVLQEATDIIYDEISKYKNAEQSNAIQDEQSHFYKSIAEEETAGRSTVKTVEERLAEKIKNSRTELLMNQQLREDSIADFEKEISRLQAEYNAKRDKNTKVANDILRRIERLQRIKNNVDADYSKRISDIKARIEKMETPEYQTAEHRKSKQEEYRSFWESFIGDTSTWKDKSMGIFYEINTLRRNLRDVVRGADGKRDIRKADAIYDELQGRYNHNEAELNRESNRIKGEFAKLKINKAESTYIQMLGEFRYNPHTTLTEDVVKDFYNKHKDRIDTSKVDKAIDMARLTYDSLLLRVNEVLQEQGMKEIPYRKGYFPHFNEDKQGFLGKLFNWKTKNDDIPTDIAGLTEMFEPNRSWQSFNKQRKGDTTEYNFLKGLDTYVQGSLDWIYHIEDIQKRRAFENHIRYIHSEQGVKDKIDAIRNNNEYDADEMQEQIDLVYKEAKNPLGNFVTDFHTQTNTLAGKKSSMDRGMEQKTNRKIYSVMTNVSNRVTANSVVGSVSSALTNFIPITQSWVQVNPGWSLLGMKKTIQSIVKDDGTIDKSDFLTNRLRKADNLYSTNWDKASDVLSIMMDGIDNFTSQTIWRSKYMQNLHNGMSEAEAIKNADQFAENVMAGRSRGNNPTLFDSKNPITKVFTAFQLEVNNQYGYMFKDAPQDMAGVKYGKAKLVAGFTTAFIGAYVYNALSSALTGRDAAFDPIGIIEDLLRDLGFGDDDEEEEEIAPVDVAMNLTENVLEEVPFVGGLLGGGRIPISSAMPYGGLMEMIEGTIQDVSDENKESLTKEWLKPLWYLASPMGGGQLKKTVEGLSMFDDDLPVSGSYTDNGDLRFPVEDTPLNKLQAAIFGQWSSKNARDYFDNNRQPLKEQQIEEFVDLDLPIAEYWEIREGLKECDDLEEKFDYIADLDLPVKKKNILINNIVDRDEEVDLENYDDFDSYDEFDFATKYPDKHEFLEENDISYEEYEDNKEEYDFAYKYPEKYEFFNSIGLSVEDYYDLDEDGRNAYSWAYNNPGKYVVSQAVTNDVIEYKRYTKALSNIKADYDRNGNVISGSRKDKVIDYINSLDIEYGQAIILYQMQYKSDDTYKEDIIDYLNNRDDISREEMITILEELGAEVDSRGQISW